MIIQAKDGRLEHFPDVQTVLDRLERFRETLTRSRYNRELSPLIATFETKLKTIFNRQGIAVADRLGVLRKYLNEADNMLGTFDKLFDRASTATSQDMLGVIETFVSRALILGGTTIVDELGLGISFSLKNPFAISWLKDYGTDRITSIDEESKSQIHTILNDAVERGWSYSRAATMIKSKFEDFSSDRAKRIAVTELGNAYQAGNLLAVKTAQEGGLKFEKFWLTVGDKRVSAHCRANSAQGWIPSEDHFSDGSDHPLAHPNCRCVLQLRRAK